MPLILPFLLVLDVLAGPILPVVPPFAELVFEDELDEEEATTGGRESEPDLDLEPTPLPALVDDPITGECKDPEPTGEGECLLLLDVRWE